MNKSRTTLKHRIDHHDHSSLKLRKFTLIELKQRTIIAEIVSEEDRMTRDRRSMLDSKGHIDIERMVQV